MKDHLTALTNAFATLPGPFELTLPIYDTSGLYYRTQREVATFEAELAAALYAFYIGLLEAERLRCVKRDDPLFPSVAKELQRVIAEAHESVPHLEGLLAKEASWSRQSLGRRRWT